MSKECQKSSAQLEVGTLEWHAAQAREKAAEEEHRQMLKRLKRERCAKEREARQAPLKEATAEAMNNAPSRAGRVI